MYKQSALAAAVALVLLSGCATAVDLPSPTPTATASATPTPTSRPAPTPTPTEPGPPPLIIEADYVDLDAVYRISRFRSGVGHDFSDSYESCSSMKHYFQFWSDVDWAAVPVFAPAQGEVVRLMTEMVNGDSGLGSQVWIASTADPSLIVRIFHVRTDAEIVEGAQVQAGQRIGTHIGQMTMSDIAIQQGTPDGFRFVSMFELMTDDLFEGYRLRGVADRAQMQFSQDERQADPLTCDGEQFVEDQWQDEATWVVLGRVDLGSESLTIGRRTPTDERCAVV